MTRPVALADIILSPYANGSDNDGGGGSSDGSSGRSWSDKADDDNDDVSGSDDGDEAEDAEGHAGLGAAWDPFAHARCACSPLGS